MAKIKVTTYEKEDNTRSNLALETPKNTGSGLSYVGQRVGIGFTSVFEGIGKFFEGSAAWLSGDENYAKYVFTKSEVGEWREDLEDDYNPGGFMSFLGDVGEGVGQSSVMLANAAVPFLGTGMFFTGIAGNSIGNAVAQTGDIGWKEYGYGLTVAGAEAMMETIIGAGGQAAKSLATAGAKSVTKSIGKATVKRAVRNGVLKNILLEGSGEFVEEFLGDYVDVTAQKIFGINENAEYSLTNALYSGLVGFVSGSAMGGGTQAIQASTYISSGSRVQKNGNVQTLLKQAELVSANYATMGGGMTKRTQMSQYISSIQASYDAYNALSEEAKAGTRGALYLGELQSAMAAFQSTQGVGKSADYIRTKPEKFAVYASQRSGKTYTVEDLLSNKDGILDRLAVEHFVGQFMTASEAERFEKGILEMMRRESAGEAADRAAFEEMGFSPEDAADAASRVTRTDGVTMISDSGAWDGESAAYKIPGGEYVFVFENGDGTYNVGVGAEADFAGGKIRIANLTREEVKEYLARVEENRILAERSAREAEEPAIAEIREESANKEEQSADSEEVSEESQTSEKKYSLAKENSDLNDLIRKVKNGEFKANEKVVFGEVSTEVAKRIKEITGIDVTGYSIAIEARQIEHILKRHGENGTADHSLANDTDLAKMEYVLENPDSIEEAGRTQAYTYSKEGKNRTASTVKLEKVIGDKSYYVVEAVPETKAKTLYVVTAFVGKSTKKEASQLIDANAPMQTSENGSVVTSKNSIPQTESSVKSEEEKNSEDNAETSEKSKEEQEAEEREAVEKYAELASIQDRARRVVESYDLRSARTRYAIEQMYRSADEAGADASAADAAAHLLAVFNGDVQIRFAKGISKNGLIDTITDEDGTRHTVILINPQTDAEEGATATLLHEVTHYLEGREGYDKLSKLALELIPAEKAEEIRKRYRDYAEKNGKKFSDEYIEQEVVAEAVGELLAKGKYIARMRNRSVIVNAASWMARHVKALVGKNREAHRAALKLQVAFTRCLARTKTEAAEVVRKYSFAGERAKIADRMRLATAQELLVNGADPEFVRRETGWFKGYDGMWRFEINDSELEISTSGGYSRNPDIRRYDALVKKVYFEGDATAEEESELQSLGKNLEGVNLNPEVLGDLIHHPTLFEAYPELENISIYFAPSAKSGTGSYHPGFKEIVLAQTDKLNPQKLKSVLIHEIQHAIQDIEGFAGGSNVDMFNDTGKRSAYQQYRDTAGEIEARDVSQRREYSAEQRKNTRPDIDRTDVVFVGEGVSYLAVANNNQSSIKQQIRENLKTINAHPVVVDIDYSPVNKKTLHEIASDRFKKLGYKVDRPGFGIVEISEKQINESFNYIETEGEKAALLAVPYVLKRGVDISGHGNHKGRSYDTVTFAGRITINGSQEGIVAVVVRRTKGNRFHAHRILMPDGSEFVFDEKVKAQNYESAGVKGNEYRQGPAISSVLDNSIPQDSDSVKGETKKFSLSKSETAEERAERLEREVEKANERAKWEKQQREFFEHHYKTAWDVRDYSDGLYRGYNGKWSKIRMRTLVLKIAGEIDSLTMYPTQKNAKQTRSNLERNLKELSEELAFNQKSHSKMKEGEFIDYPKIMEEMGSKIKADLSEIMKQKLKSLDRAYNLVVYEFGERIGTMRLEPYSVRAIWQEADRILKAWGEAHDAEKRYKGGHQAKAQREFLFRLNEAGADWDLATVSDSLATDLIEHIRFKTEKGLRTAKRLDPQGFDVMRSHLAEAILIMTQAEINESEVNRAREAEKVLKGEAALVDRLRKAEKFLNGKTKPSDKPDADLQELRPIFEGFTKIVERGRITKKRAKKFAADLLRMLKLEGDNSTLERVKDTMQTTGTYDIIDEIALLDDAKDTDLTLEMVKGLNDLYFELSRIYEIGNKNLIDGKWVDRVEVAKKGVKDANGSLLHLNRRKTLRQKLSRGVLEFLIQSQDPLRTVAMLEGYAENGVLSKLIYDVVMGEAYRVSMQMDFLKPFEDFFKAHKGYQQKLATKEIELDIFSDGKNKFKITLGEAMSMLALSKREQAKAGLANSDIYFANDEEGTRMVQGGWARWADMDADQRISMLTGGISELVKKLEKEDLEFFKMVEHFFNAVSTDVKKRSDVDYFGHEMTMESYYFPIYRDRSTIAEEVADAAKRMQSFITVSNQSFNKQTMKNASKSLYIANVYDVVTQHATGLATYATLYRPVLNFNTIWNQQTSGNKNSPESMRSVYERNVWDGVNGYMKSLFDAVQGIRDRKTPFSGIISKIRGNAVFFQLGLNPKTWLTQWTSLIASLDVLSASSLQKGIAAGKKANDADMDKYSVFARTRDYNMEVVKAEGAGDQIHKVGELTMKPISLMDRMVIRKLWAACQYEVESKQGLAIGSEENNVAAGKLLDTVILRTQQTAGMATKSGLMRGGELAKSLTMFSSDAMKQLSSMIERVGRYQRARVDVKNGVAGAEERLAQSKKALAKTGASLIGVAVAGAIIAQVFKALYDRDRRKKKDGTEISIPADVALDSFGNFVGVIPVVRDVYDMIDSGYEVSDFTLDAFNNIISGYLQVGEDVIRAIGGEYVSNEEIAADVRQFIYSTGMVLGIPTRNFNNILEGGLNVTTDQGHWWYTSLFQKPSYEKDLQEAINSGDTALAELILETWLEREKVGSVGDETDVLMELYAKGYDFLPASAPSKLSAKQRKEWMESMEEVQSEAAQMVTSSTWKSFTDEAKAEALKKLYQNRQTALKAKLQGKKTSRGAVLAEWYGDIPVAEISGMAAATEAYEDESGREVPRREQVEELLSQYEGDEAILLYIAGFNSKEAKRLLAERVMEIAATEDERNALYKTLGIDPADL